MKGDNDGEQKSLTVQEIGVSYMNGSKKMMIEKEFDIELFGKYRVKGIARIKEIEVPTCTHSRALDPCYKTRRILKDIEFDKIIDLDDDIYSKLARAIEEEIKIELT